MRKLKRRLQQLFIVCAIVGAGSVVACSSDTDFKDIILSNDTDNSITIAVDGILNFDEEAEFVSKKSYREHDLEPGQSKSISLFGYEGSRSWFFFEKDNYAAARILTGEEDFRFWVELKAIGKAGCGIHVTDQLLDHLRANHDRAELLLKDRLPIDDPELLNPGGVTGESFEECFDDDRLRS